MTLKSLYEKSKFPEKLFVSLLQQNCFETVCKTGVLKGSIIIIILHIHIIIMFDFYCYSKY